MSHQSGLGHLVDLVVNIVNQRATPGTLIFDRNKQLLFFNKEALNLLSQGYPKYFSEVEQGRPGIPEEIYSLCDQVNEPGQCLTLRQKQGNHGSILHQKAEFICTARAFLIGGQEDLESATHIMVLLERVVMKHTINYDEVSRRFNLSKRELEVVQLICEGLTNREIAEKLFISEHTVKDHLKKIMRKMEVATRNEMVAVLL